MTQAPFSLQHSLIYYDGDGRAIRVPLPLTESGRAALGSVLGIVAFSHDDSVHAGAWECHPAGDELLYVLEGCLLASIDRNGTVETAVIEQGQALIVPCSTWHCLQVLQPGRLLFVTPTAGSGNRARAFKPAGADDTALARE